MAIFVIDDHPLMREAIAMLLRRVRPGSEVVELSRLSELRHSLTARYVPELFCLDFKLPDTVGASGVELLKETFPHVPLAVISASAASEVEDLCRDAGADVYIEKSAGAAEIANALRAMLAVDSCFGELAESPHGEEVPLEPKLSKRQKQLIAMLDGGLSNREIADQLGISEHTVKVHLWRLFRRLGVKSRTQTLHYARMNGLLLS